MKRVMVTGATGFVGANLARRLLQDGHQLHLLVRPGFSDWRIQAIRTDVSLYEVELRDAERLEQVVKEIRPEWVFHLAAHGAYSWQTDLRQMAWTNFLGTINLVEACLKAGAEVFINTGSSSEYGYKSFAPSETENLEPNSHYAVTKASATLFCRYTAQHSDMRLYTLRLYSVYGPYEAPKRLMPTLILHGLRGKFPPLVRPEIVRDFVYVEDVNDAYLLAASKAEQEVGAVYNVGTGVQTSMRQVVAVARQILPFTAEPEWGAMPDRSWDTTSWGANNKKITAELGWRPRYTFSRGFSQQVEWFRGNPSILEFYSKNLGFQ
jgi:UDP-glucose 4-epimerase